MASKKIGEKYGPFTILGTIRKEYSNGTRVTLYKCECEKCGNTEIKALHLLKQFKGEGCLKCTPKLTRKPVMTMDERNYKNYKNKILAQCPGREFNLILSEFNSLVKQNCYYCGSEPIFPERFKNEFKQRDIEFYNGIDRIDSNKGYIFNNCVPCCFVCNRMKMDLEQSYFLDHINKIYEFNKGSTTSPKDVASSECEMGDIQTDNAEDNDIV